MRRTPDIREFKPEHLLDMSDLLKYLKNGFHVEPQTKVIEVNSRREYIHEVNSDENRQS